MTKSKEYGDNYVLIMKYIKRCKYKIATRGNILVKFSELQTRNVDQILLRATIRNDIMKISYGEYRSML